MHCAGNRLTYFGKYFKVLLCENISLVETNSTKQVGPPQIMNKVPETTVNLAAVATTVPNTCTCRLAVFSAG